MGERGPAKSPTSHLKATGSWRANARKHEPQYNVAIPRPPDWVQPQGHEFYRKLARRMAAAGVMTSIDYVGLAMLTNAWLSYIEAKKIIDAEGVIIRCYKNGVPCSSEHPAVKVMNSQWDRVFAMTKQFGLTPSSRAGLEVGMGASADGSKEADDDRFFKIGG